MVVEDVFMIRARGGTVLAGQVESGSVTKFDQLLLHHGGFQRSVIVQGVEISHQSVSQAHIGDFVGILLRDSENLHVQRGDVLTASLEL